MKNVNFLRKNKAQITIILHPVLNIFAMKILIPLLFVLSLMLTNCQSPDSRNVATNDHPDNASVADSLHLKLISELQSALDTLDFLNQHNYPVAFLLSDAETNESIVSLNERMSLLPASVLKVMTTAIILEKLGSDFRFETRFAYSGTIDSESQTLNGNVYIIGGGDPCFGSKRFKSDYYQPELFSSVLMALRKLGVKKISGDIISDAQIFDDQIVPTSWTWEDIAAYYGTAASGLSIYDNTMHVNFDVSKKGSYTLGKNDLKPYVPNLKFENKIRISSGKYYLDILGAYYDNVRIIHGVVPPNVVKTKIDASIPDPPFLAAYDLKNFLEASGIEVAGTPTSVRRLISEGSYKKEKLKTICKMQSPYLSSIIRETNIFSINLYAEHMLKYMGYNETGFGSDDSGIAAVKSFLKEKGLYDKGFFMADGCGISRKNRISVKTLNDILFYMYNKSENSEAFEASLAVAGQSGTLKSLGRNSEFKGKYIGKSGSMGGVKCYTGYLKVSDKTFIFTIIANNYTQSSSTIRKYTEELISNIFTNLQNDDL